MLLNCYQTRPIMNIWSAHFIITFKPLHCESRYQILRFRIKLPYFCTSGLWWNTVFYYSLAKRYVNTSTYCITATLWSIAQDVLFSFLNLHIELLKAAFDDNVTFGNVQYTKAKFLQAWQIGLPTNPRTRTVWYVYVTIDDAWQPDLRISSDNICIDTYSLTTILRIRNLWQRLQRIHQLRQQHVYLSYHHSAVVSNV